MVLVLRLPADAPPDPSRARGLLLLRARDPALLVRLIDAINSAQRGSGELARVQDRRRAGTTYHVREFPEDSGRPPEWYVGYPDGTFAFSNSEAMIQGVVDRKPPGPSPPRVGSTKWRSPRSRARPGRPAEAGGRPSTPAGAGAGPAVRGSPGDRAAPGRGTAVPPSRPTSASWPCCGVTWPRSSTPAPRWSGGTMRSSSTRSRRSTPRGWTPGSGDGPATPAACRAELRRVPRTAMAIAVRARRRDGLARGGLSRSSRGRSSAAPQHRGPRDGPAAGTGPGLPGPAGPGARRGRLSRCAGRRRPRRPRPTSRPRPAVPRGARRGSRAAIRVERINRPEGRCPQLRLSPTPWRTPCARSWR